MRPTTGIGTVGASFTRSHRILRPSCIRLATPEPRSAILTSLAGRATTNAVHESGEIFWGRICALSWTAVSSAHASNRMSQRVGATFIVSTNVTGSRINCAEVALL